METLRFHAITSTAVHWVRHHSGQWQFFDPPTDWQETDYEAAKSGLGTFRIGPVPTDEIYLAAASTEETVLCCDNDLYMALAFKTPTPKNIMKLVSRYGFLGDEPFRRINRKDARQLQKLLDCGSGLEADLPRIESVTHWLYAHHLLNFCLRHWVDLKPGKNRKAVERFLSVLNLAGATLEPELRLDDHSKSVSFDLVATSLSDALKFQLAMAVSENASPRKCLECPTWFRVSHGAGRPEKLYCRPACKMRGWRRQTAVT